MTPNGVALMVLMASIWLAAAWWMYCEILELIEQGRSKPIPVEVIDELRRADRRRMAAEGMARREYEKKVTAVLDFERTDV